MTVFTAILLGLLQGVTVFLPVSYSGHQAIFHKLFNIDMPASGLFAFFMNTSTLVSILMVYRKEVGQLVQEGMTFLRGKGNEDPVSEGRMSAPLRVIYFIFIGTIPLILTLLINKKIDILMKNTVFIGCAMIVMGVILFAADKYVKPGKKSEKTMTTKDALLIGLGQAFAIIPGLARTGTTIAIGLACGQRRDFAVRFSIFLSLPAVVVSILSAFFTLFRNIDWSTFIISVVGFAVSVSCGYLSLQMLRLLTRKRKLRNFSFYLWFAGVITVVLSLILSR